MPAGARYGRYTALCGNIPDLLAGKTSGKIRLPDFF